MKSTHLLTGILLVAVSFTGCKASHRGKEASKNTGTTASPAPATTTTTTTTTTSTATPAPKSSKFESEVELTITCKNATQTREIEVVKSGEGCEVLYTKGGADAESVAQGKSGTDYCKATAEKMRTNMAKGGWDCKS